MKRQIVTTFFIALATFSCNQNTSEENVQIDVSTKQDTISSSKTPQTIAQVLDTPKRESSAPKINNAECFTKFLGEHRPKAQVFYIYNARDTIIKCLNGTLLFIPYHAFSGAWNKTIQLTIEEYYSPASIILNNLSTTSDHSILETGGMINVKAFLDNKELALANDKSLIIHFPKSTTTKPMELFNGSYENKIINWKKNSESLIEFRLTNSGSQSIPNWQEQNLEKSMKDIRLEFDYSTLFKKIENSIELSQVELKNMYEKETKMKIGLRFEVEDNSNPKIIIENSPDEKTSTSVKTLMTDYISQFSKTHPNWRQDRHEFITIASRPTPLGNYKKNFKEKYSSYVNNGINSMDFSELKYYVFQTSELGWINCDRFINNDNERIDFFVNVEDDFTGQLNLKVNDLNSFIRGKRENNYFVFERIPINLSIKIIAIKMDNGKPLLATKLVVTSKDKITLNEYHEFSLNELDKVMN